MPDFVNDSLTLTNDKADLAAPPEGHNPQNYVVATDWNALCDAALSLRTALHQGKYHGLTGQADEYAPPAASGLVLWYRTSDGALLVRKGTADPVSIVTGDRSITPNNGLTGGGTLDGDLVIGMASLSPSPAGTYAAPRGVVVNARGQVTEVAEGEGIVRDDFPFVNVALWTGGNIECASIADGDDAYWKGGWLILDPVGTEDGRVRLYTDRILSLEVGTIIRAKIAMPTLAGLIFGFTYRPSGGDEFMAALAHLPDDLSSPNFFMVGQDGSGGLTSVDTGLVATTGVKILEVEVVADGVEGRIYNEAGSLLGQSKVTTTLPSTSDALCVYFMCATARVYSDWVWWRQA